MSRLEFLLYGFNVHKGLILIFLQDENFRETLQTWDRNYDTINSEVLDEIKRKKGSI